MVERILTLRELNRATLARQMLLERESIPLLEAIERLVGLQAQVPNPPYIGLWTRLQDMRRDDLTRLMEQRQVVRATLMRFTLHLFTARDYLMLRSALQPALTRALQAFFGRQVKGLDIKQIVAVAREFVEEQPRTFAEIRARLAQLEPDRDPEALASIVRAYLPLVQLPPAGTWGSGGSPAHALAEMWLGQPLADSSEGFRLLVLRYLAAFGPATVKDIQTWSGLVKLRGSIEGVKPELRTFRDEQGNELLDLPNMVLPSEDIPTPLRFLPEYDNLVLSHADRGRIVPDRYRHLVFLSAARVRATFLVDGFVGGTWKIEKEPGVARLVIEPFEPFSYEVQAALVKEGERLVRFIEDRAEQFDVRFAANG